MHDWPVSPLDRPALINAIGKFLRTHKHGGSRLLTLLESVPQDRTEEEYRALREASKLYMPSGW